MHKDTESAARLERRRNRETGFSIVELVVVTAIIFIVAAMAVLQLQPAWQQIQANAALSQVKSTLRQGREMAISQRRTIVVQFLTAGATPLCPQAGNTFNCIALTLMVVSPGNPPTQAIAANPFLVVPLESNVQFMSYAGEPDTPDAFIGAGPTAPNGLYFGSTSGTPTSGLQFQSDGTFTNGNVNPVNFTIFMGEANIPTTARAITILGNTGKVTGYAGTGKAWFR
ncbi:MAG TPA: prepilin-type N-terminal cleavage/methylation domain-containing protein [Verrucomicrobiae bacterium]|nr:prepilin-type N-terminal cleavage/methylation domain-containing protein [Verrucomicrobiae bacterium]